MITRRDFMNGIAIAVAGVSGSDAARAQSPASESAAKAATAANYPPALTGLRGSHVGSFESAHRLRDGGSFDLSGTNVTEQYDLIVVGAGISGLAAAYFYRQQRPAARVLILDTNDDFGGHAKRNEFTVDGRTLIGYGGTQSTRRRPNTALWPAACSRISASTCRASRRISIKASMIVGS
jgi:spermidine dehydrogenase